MSNTKQSSPSIAKNTLLLYVRMGITMIVGLFTSRIILNALGEVDYGIYGVVGSMVGMLSFINGTLACSVSRYFSVAIGRDDKEYLSNLFAISLNMHLALGILLALGLDTAGVWFLYSKMTIPEESLTPAFWVLQFSILSMILSCTSVPYVAALIGFENMKIYAYLGLYDAFSKLVIVYWVAFVDSDRLVFYAFLNFVNSAIVQIIYRIYVRRHYPECRFRWVYDKPIIKDLLSYTGWSLFNGVAVMCQGSGLNVLLNVFFGPVVNAARSIAVTVQSAVSSFVGGFTQASRPRVVKYASREEYEAMYSLTFRTAKVSFFLMLMLAVPICYNLPTILRMWLGDVVPPDTVTFTEIIVVGSLLQTYHTAFLMPFQGIGRVKVGFMVSGVLMTLSLPVCYVFIKFGAPAWSAFVVTVSANTITHIISWCIIHSYAYFSVKRLIGTVYLPTIAVALLGSVIPLILLTVLPKGTLYTFINIALSELVLLPLIIFVGFNSEDRKDIIYPTISKAFAIFRKPKSLAAKS